MIYKSIPSFCIKNMNLKYNYGVIRLLRYDIMLKIWTTRFPLVCACSVLVTPSSPLGCSNLNLDSLDDPLSDFWSFKQIQAQFTTWRNKWNRKWIFCKILCTLTERCYLRSHKGRRRNLNVYPNTYSCESSFLFRGNSAIRFNHKNPNKQSKRDILMKLTKNC